MKSAGLQVTSASAGPNVRVTLVQIDTAARSSLTTLLEDYETLLRSAGVTKPGDTDLVLMPETCFSPYLFRGESAASKAASPAALRWLAATAKRLRCGFVAGIVRRDDGGNLYNSAVVIDPEGETIATVDKQFLYDSDRTWARSVWRGDASRRYDFPVLTLPWLNLKVCVAICNDLNGPTFSKDDMNAYLFAAQARDQGASVLLVPTAWCSAHPLDAPERHDAPIFQETQHDYWAERMTPLHGSGVYLCVADRVGREPLSAVLGARARGRIRYCGSSCVLRFDPEGPVVVRSLGVEEEGAVTIALN